jgi:hypothetical protein
VKDAEEKNKVSRPLAISIVAACSFLIGLIGTLAGGLLGLFLLQSPNVSTAFVQNSTFLTLLWLVIGPILIYSGYNLFKMKKWAAQTVATVILFDLVASPLFLAMSQSSIGATEILGWSVDVIMLLMLASAWHTKFNQ